MMQHYFGTHFIGSFLFSALLPPRDDEELSFYEILGLENSNSNSNNHTAGGTNTNTNTNTASDDEIRKAYRKLSLKLHPDKIAQRYGGADTSKKEEAAAEYEKVQEAYNILMDEKKRLKYDALGTPTRYRFVEQGAFANPQAVFENLTSASFVDKSRLLGLFFILILLVLLQPILIAAKINQDLQVVGGGALATASWFAILVPYWVMEGLIIILTFIAAFYVPTEDRLAICLTGLEQLFWYLGVIFLCLSWDGSWGDSILYRQIFAPVYIAMILRWFRSFLVLHKVRTDVNRMVTVDYIDKEFLKGKSMDELSEEELTDLKKAFLVVSVDPEFEPHATDLSTEELEEEKVESSPEFESATEIYNTTFGGLACSIVFGGIFLILLTLKLDDRLNNAGNWWAVFSPIWIERGGRLVSKLYNCLCGGISGEEIVLYAGASDFPTADGVDDEEKDNDNDYVDDKSSEQEILKKEGIVNTMSSETNVGDQQQTNAPIGTDTLNVKGDEETEDKSDDENKKSEDSATTDTIAEVEDNAEHALPADENDDDEEIHIDEETYHAWQSAYAQAEKNANQERAQSFSDCLVLIFQIILLCLVVAKIEKNYDNVDPNDTGFNVFWILFPFFLFFGCTCCCCTMLIFGAEPEQSGDDTDEVDYDPENPPVHNNEGDATNAPANPDTDYENTATEQEEIPVDVTATPAEKNDPATTEKSDLVVAPANSNMDDLD